MHMPRASYLHFNAIILNVNGELMGKHHNRHPSREVEGSMAIFIGETISERLTLGSDYGPRASFIQSKLIFSTVCDNGKDKLSLSCRLY